MPVICSVDKLGFLCAVTVMANSRRTFLCTPSLSLTPLHMVAEIFCYEYTWIFHLLVLWGKYASACMMKKKLSILLCLDSSSQTLISSKMSCLYFVNFLLLVSSRTAYSDYWALVCECCIIIVNYSERFHL